MFYLNLEGNNVAYEEITNGRIGEIVIQGF